MTQIGIGEKGKQDDNAQLIINSPYVIQPHLQKKKPSTFLMLIAILLTLAVIVMTLLGIVWLVRTHLWLTDLQQTTTPPMPTDNPGEFGAQSFDDQPTIKSMMTFDDIWSLRPKGFSGQWLNEWGTHKLIYRDEEGNLIERDFDDNGTSNGVLVNHTVFAENNVTRYYPNQDGRYVLFIYDEVKVWRHSYQSFVKIYDTQDEREIDFPNQADLRTERLQFVSWAPRDNGLIFVQNNNIYYQNGPEGTPRQITTNGGVNIFNGIPDWLYEEDVLGSARASYMSDDGRFLVFGRFDVTNVDRVEYPLYLPTSDVYASQYSAAYPMAGKLNADGSAGPNTEGTLWVVDTQQGGTVLNFVQITPPTELQSVDHYFTRVAFVENDTIAVTWTNRVQNESIIQISQLVPNTNAAPTVDSKNNFRHTVENGWIDSPWPAPVPNLYDEDGAVYYTYLLNDESAGRYLHLAQITVPDNNDMGEVTFLTPGEQEVQGVIAYDKERDMLYYYSTNGSQRDRHLMRMRPGDDSTILCITCQLESCSYASAQFSPSMNYFLLSCLGPDIPCYEVMNISSTSAYALQEVMEDNIEFRDEISSKDLPRRLWGEIVLGNDQVGSYDIYRPPNVEEGSTHPLLVYAYAGPGSLQVTSRYGYGSTINSWLRYLGSAYNIAVASVDVRGSVGKGEDWKFQMYRKLGTIEIEDQIEFGRAIKAKYDFINQNEAAIFGWSYGGFVSSHVIGQETDHTYHCGVAVAPVTSQRYYDTAYTERYMGLATENDNAAGYAKTDLFPYASNYTGKKYFIAHGTHDDNVHFRNVVSFIHALVEAEVQFRQMVYVDEDHSINSPHQSRHLFRAMTNFLNNDCYQNGFMTPTTPAPWTPSNEHKVGMSASDIAWTVIGSLAGVVLIILLAVWYLKSRKRKDNNECPIPLLPDGSEPEEAPPGDYHHPSTPEEQPRKNWAPLPPAPLNEDDTAKLFDSDDTIIINIDRPLFRIDETNAEDEIDIYGNVTLSEKLRALTPFQYELGAEIQTGKFAVIKLAMLKDTVPHQRVASKMAKKADSLTDAVILRGKLNFLATELTEHPNIVNFIAADLAVPMIFMDLCDGGSLTDWVQVIHFVTPVIKDAMMFFCYDIICGLEHLHGLKVLHRRLGIRNVLLGSSPERKIAKITGYGPLEKETDAEENDGEVPIRWLPPESLDRLPGKPRSYSEAVDMWSFGVTIWEIYSRAEQPFEGCDLPQLKEQLKKGDRLLKPRDCPKLLFESVVQPCWSFEPLIRPLAKHVRTALSKMTSSGTDIGTSTKSMTKEVTDLIKMHEYESRSSTVGDKDNTNLEVYEIMIDSKPEDYAKLNKLYQNEDKEGYTPLTQDMTNSEPEDYAKLNKLYQNEDNVGYTSLTQDTKDATVQEKDKNDASSSDDKPEEETYEYISIIF